MGRSRGPSHWRTEKTLKKNPEPREESPQIPSPPDPQERREPLPWTHPKPAEEDPGAPERVKKILQSPSYRPAVEDLEFLEGVNTRGLRLQMDYLKPELSLRRQDVGRTIVVFGSTRICEPSEARRRVEIARAKLVADNGAHDSFVLERKLAVAERILAKSRYYEVAREFGKLVGAANLTSDNKTTLIVTGGGPGIMEAANRGAFDVGAKSIGLNISLPHEQYPNPYVTPELCFQFRYFALRKLHFLQRARALVAFPGGYGTCDELFEVLTLVQTRKKRPIPIVLVGEAFWRKAIDFDFLAEEGVIDLEDRELFWFAETAQDIFDGVQKLGAQGAERNEVSGAKRMKLSFHGADRGVTGSCHLLEAGGKKILVDCGLFQGSRRIDEENAAAFGFDAANIDFVLLTHAHLDHCGRLPLLARRGFSGEIVSTAATRDLTRLVLLDAAHLQEEEAKYHARLSERRGEKDGKSEPLYSLLDALDVFDRFGRNAVYGKPMELAPGLRATFFDAGHILGSASVLVEAEGKRLLFSGDIGNYGRPLLGNPAPPENVDAVVMETTYGDRLHRSLDSSIDEFYEALNASFRRGGNVIIPTFALERAQELLFYLREGIEQNKLPASLPVFLDLPMAISATEIFRKHPECYGPETAQLFARKIDPFGPPGLHFCRETAESIALNTIRGGAVIMAGAGMCSGGRVRHHLRHNLGRADCSVIFVGFAAEGTLGRQIVDGAKHVTIFGEPIAVRAHIITINGFSAHADQAELLAWRKAVNPRRTFLVHGEEASMQAFAEKLGSALVDMPALGQAFEL